jgi:hypothetical protein
MRDLMACYNVTNNWMMVSYLFDKDILFKEYNAVFELLLHNSINNILYFNDLFISYYFELNLVYKKK